MDTRLSLPSLSLQKPEKIVLGVIVGMLGVLTIGAGWGLYLLLPILERMARTGLYLSLELLGLGGLIALVVQGYWMRTSIVYGMKMFAKKVARKRVAKDPIASYAIAIERFEAKLDEINQNLSNAAAARKRVQNKIRNHQKTGSLDFAEQEEALFAWATKSGHPQAECRQHAVNAKRWRDVTAGLEPVVESLSRMQVDLERARDLCVLTLDDRKNLKASLSVQLAAMKEGQMTVRAFRGFLSNNADLEMENISVEEIERQTTEAEAEIESFIRAVAPRVAAGELKQAAEAEIAVARLTTAAGLSAPAAIKDGVIVR